MRRLEEYMTLPYRREIVADNEGGFVVSYPVTHIVKGVSHILPNLKSAHVMHTFL